jgi:hypothetical protein
MMRLANRLGMVVLALAGCSKTDPLFCQENPGASGCPRPDGDLQQDDGGGIDMSGPAVDARLCYGVGAYTVCFTTPASGTLLFQNPATLDTSPGSTTTPACLPAQPMGWTAAGQPEACFIVASSMTFNALVQVRGSRPLVLVAASSITFNATGGLDVSSKRGGLVGPGAAQQVCPAFPVTPTNSTSGGGGGAGGSFMTQGGPGGDGNNGSSANGVAPAAEAVNPAVLRAGCPGQAGGTGQNGANQGLPGPGGGAVFLLAGDSISLAAGTMINASGAGAIQAGRYGGGGGGGSGGTIVLHAPAITATGAFLMANGGGGSGGGHNSGNGGAGPGEDPSTPLTPAAGGTAADNAGPGGRGFAEGFPALGGGLGASSRGGGGGGGGGGWIEANVDPDATASPAVVIIP